MTAVLCAHDAKSRRDPTGTSGIRSRFRNEADRRLQSIKNSLRAAFSESNILGLRGNLPAQFGPGIDTASRVRMFGTWFNEEVYRTLVSRDASWTRSYVQQAYAQGLARARSEMGVQGQSPISIVPARGRLGVYEEMAATDLSGIADEMVKLTCRAAADAAAKGAYSSPTCRACIEKINKTIRSRLHLMTNTLTVRPFNDAKLEQYQRHGIARVGLLPETLPAKVRRIAGDAVPLSRRRDLGRIVEVLTAQDDVVCVDCQALADAGPYKIEDVYGVLPYHPRCRCSWVTADDPRLEDEFG